MDQGKSYLFNKPSKLVKELLHLSKLTAVLGEHWLIIEKKNHMTTSSCANRKILWSWPLNTEYLYLICGVLYTYTYKYTTQISTHTQNAHLHKYTLSQVCTKASRYTICISIHVNVQKRHTATWLRSESARVHTFTYIYIHACTSTDVYYKAKGMRTPDQELCIPILVYHTITITDPTF